MNITITKKIIAYFKEKPAVKKVYIFGSYARNEENPESDIDILLDMNPKKPIGRFQFGEMLEDLKELLLIDIDLITSKSVSKHILPLIDKDKILIYKS